MQIRQKGFTLIELLVVISVMGLMAAVIMVSMNSVRAKGRDARRVANLNQVYKLVELYYDDQGHYPDFSGSTGLDNFVSMVEELQAQGYLPPAEAEAPHDSWFALIKEAQAGYDELPGTFKDPLFDPEAHEEDGVYAYMYRTPSNPGAGFRLRTKLENPSHQALANGLSGQFLHSGHTTGHTACDKSLGYYCVGSGNYTVD